MLHKLDPSTMLPERTSNGFAPPKLAANDRCSSALALEATRLIFGCYRKGDANDPEIFATSVSVVLSEYPEWVVRKVSDPRTGIPGRLKFLPVPAEVREACEAEMEPIRRREARDKRFADTYALLDEREAPQRRPTIEELKARCGGDNWGIQSPSPTKRDPVLTPAQLREKYGMSQEAFDAIPNRL